MKRRIWSVLLTLVMALSLLPTAALANNTTACSGGDNCTHAAAIGNTHYDTLKEAVETAETGEDKTITLLKDLENTGNIVLPAKVTLNGGGKTLSGDSCVTVDAAGGTIQNVVFKNIHNTTQASSDNCKKYGWASKTGTLSAIYSTGLNGTLTVTSCTFDNVDWDAIQVSGFDVETVGGFPRKNKTDASVVITDCIFRTAGKNSTQLRYIHIEAPSDKSNTEMSLTITDNQFYASSNAETSYFNPLGLYRIKTATGSNLTGNYVEEPDKIETGGSDCTVDMIEYFPMRSAAGVNEDDMDIPYVAYVSMGREKLNRHFKTLDELSTYIKDKVETDTSVGSYSIHLEKDITMTTAFDLRGVTKLTFLYLEDHTLTAQNCEALKINRNGSNYMGICGPGSIISKGSEQDCCAIVCEGETNLQFQSNPTVTGGIKNDGTGTVSIASGTFDGELENTSTGAISAIGGSFDRDPRGLIIGQNRKTHSAAQEEGGRWKVEKLTTENAANLGFPVTSMTSVKYFYGSIQARADESDTAYLLDNVTEDFAWTWGVKRPKKNNTLYLENHTYEGSITDMPNGDVGTYCTMINGNRTTNEKKGAAKATLNKLTTKKTLKAVANANVTVKDGTAAGIYVDKVSKITIENGYYSGTIEVKSSGGLAGELNITGGYFAADPSDYIDKKNYYVDASNISGYPYVVRKGSKPDDGAIVIVKDRTTPSISDEVKSLTKKDEAAITKNTKVQGVTEAVASEKNTLVAKSGIDTAAKGVEKIEVDVDVKVELTAADLSAANKTMTYTATPVATVTTTDFNGKVVNKKENVAVPNHMLSGEMTVRLPLPADFDLKQIIHRSSGYADEYILAKSNTQGLKSFELVEGDGVTLAVFTVTHFSTFELSGTVTYVAPVVVPSVSVYPVTIEDSAHGSVTADRKSAVSGGTVTLTVAPDKGWTLEALTVLDKNGQEVDLTIVTVGGKYTFRMPSGGASVTATFMEDNTMLNYFVDVNARDYFYDAVLWAAQKGITTGTDALHFAPNDACTRGQIVTFLWRAAGSPTPKSAAMPFADVKSGSYCYDAVLWAIENGVTIGTSATTFSPDEPCTRAHGVTFLYRLLGQQTTTGTRFTDVPSGSYYENAVDWAVTSAVTKGTSATTFSPNDLCTRAQMVTFLYRAYQGK